MTTEEAQENSDRDILSQAVAALAEHFDTVQIFASRYDSETGNTTTISRGTGNWMARYGQIDTWLIGNKEAEREKARMDVRDSEGE